MLVLQGVNDFVRQCNLTTEFAERAKVDRSVSAPPTVTDEIEHTGLWQIEARNGP